MERRFATFGSGDFTSPDGCGCLALPGNCAPSDFPPLRSPRFELRRWQQRIIRPGMYVSSKKFLSANAAFAEMTKCPKADSLRRGRTESGRRRGQSYGCMLLKILTVR